MNRGALTVLLVVVLFAAAGGGYWAGKSQPGASPSAGPAAKPAGPPPGIAVEAIKVASVQLPQAITAVGSLRSDEAVILRPEVAGRIAEILFKEGQRVEKGQLLIRLDSTVQRAELEQAKANLSLSRSKFERAVDLEKKGFISSQAREEAENNFRVSQASVDLFSARLAKLDLKAPFSGIAGLRQVSAGDYVKDGQDLVNIEEIDPLKVDFRVAEIYLKQLATGQNLQLGVDAFPNQTFTGHVLAINPLIDTNGRSVVIRAQVRNPNRQMRPGMFARVRLMIGGIQDSLVVPEQALVPVGDDMFVFKVVDGRAQRVKIDIGQRRDAMVEVVKGLAKDDIIVTAGQQKVREGSAVKALIAAAPVTEKQGNGSAPPGASASPAPKADAGSSPASANNGKS
jgi:membrane fusion protein (multidrug efflux system)